MSFFGEQEADFNEDELLADFEKLYPVIYSYYNNYVEEWNNKNKEFPIDLMRLYEELINNEEVISIYDKKKYLPIDEILDDYILFYGLKNMLFFASQVNLYELMLLLAVSVLNMEITKEKKIETLRTAMMYSEKEKESYLILKEILSTIN
jgi:hypothetical protein